MFTIGDLSTAPEKTSISVHVQEPVSPSLAVVAILTLPTMDSAGCGRLVHGTLQA